jgi:carbonic anhydrase
MNRKVLARSSFAVLIAASLALSACNSISKPAVSTPISAAPTPPAAAVHFTYEGEDGPAHWGTLKTDWAVCGTGKQQSPIDIVKAAPQDLPNIVFHYQPSNVTILNNGHTIQVNYDAGSYIELDGVRFDLLQFHFHAPSEHSINGKLAEAELHLVHKNAAGELAVVGVMIDTGADENPAFKNVWDNVKAPVAAGPVVSLTVQVNAADMLPKVQTTYRYIGSLTTPPCSENVKWNVMLTPIEMSKSQLAAFTQLFEGNNRPVQDLNGRPLVEDTTP